MIEGERIPKFRGSWSQIDNVLLITGTQTWKGGFKFRRGLKISLFPVSQIKTFSGGERGLEQLSRFRILQKSDQMELGAREFCYEDHNLTHSEAYYRRDLFQERVPKGETIGRYSKRGNKSGVELARVLGPRCYGS